MVRRARRWSPENGEVETQQEEPQQPEPEQVKVDEPASAGGPTGEPETPAEPEPGPLSKLQTAVRELLDFDQISEIRLALQGRREDLEKHRKKGAELGVYEPDTHRRIALLDGSDTRFGLIRIFAREEATETRDLFFDAEKPNGRPDAEGELDETITFRTVDGRDITCHRDKLWEHAPDLRALFTAGTLEERLQNEIKDQDFWHEIEPEVEPVGAEA